MRRALVVGFVLVGSSSALAWTLADSKPDPNVQAVADGCERNTTQIYTGAAPNWVYVNDRDAPAGGPPPPARWVAGVVASRTQPALAARVATSDDPITHRSFDFNIDLRVDPGADFLTGTSRDTTSEQGTLHLERETGSYPTFAWPEPGDHVDALGSWVWDCDHFQGRGEKTEFHPFRAAWVVRNPGGPSSRSPRGESEGDVFVSSDGTPAGIQAECAHRTKGSAAFKSCAHSGAERLDVNGAYGFDLTPPPRPSRSAQLVVRVVDRGSVHAPRVQAVFNDAVVHVSFTVAAKPGERVVVAKQVFAGWTPLPKTKLPVHLRVRFDSVLVRRAMDPSCPPDKPGCPARNESTLLGQIATVPGEWQLTWRVGAQWGAWSPRTLPARDGSVFRGHQRVDLYVPRGKPWTLVTEARECDFGALGSFDGPSVPVAPCPRTNEVGNAAGDDYAGAVVARFASPARSLGRHRTDASTAGSTCPPSNTRGCYQLTYTVSRIR